MNYMRFCFSYRVFDYGVYTIDNVTLNVKILI
jgi:hypothetical protein